MLRPFELCEPASVAEASELLLRHGEAARIYAGGTELILAMKEGLIHYDYLVNVKTVPGLAGVRLDADGSLRIGAATPHRVLERDPSVSERFPAIARMEANVANVRVRQVGTLGGNLCFAEPHADPGILLMALGAKMMAEKSSSKREITAEAFFVDAYETCLEADEMLTEIRVPVPKAKSGVAYLKFGYLESPSVGVAVALTLSGDGKAVGDIKIEAGCVGPAPKGVPESEAILKGKSTDEAVHRLAEAGEVAGRAVRAISDLH